MDFAFDAATIEAAIKRYNATRGTYAVYRAYARGEQELKYLDADLLRESGKEMRGLRENLCAAAISAFTSPLHISSWGSNQNDEVARTARLTSALKTAWAEAHRCGAGYIIVSRLPDGSLIPFNQRADQVRLIGDDFNPRAAKGAVRFWVDGAGYPRLTTWDAAVITEYKALKPFELLDSGNAKVEDFPAKLDSWAIETPPTAHGFEGVPVERFRRGSEDPWDDGQSLLTDVIPLQDGLNASLANTVVLAQAYARPFWYLLNYQPKQSDNPLAAARALAQALQQAAPDFDVSQSEGFDRKKQRIFTTDSPGPFGQLEPPDLSRLLDLQDRFAAKVARVIGVPLYFFTQTQGDTPSGASLRVLTQRRTDAITDFQDEATDSCIRIGQLLGMTDPVPVWVDPAPMDTTEELAIADTKYNRLGYALEDALAALNEVDVAEIVARAQARAKGEEVEGNVAEL